VFGFGATTPDPRRGRRIAQADRRGPDELSFTYSRLFVNHQMWPKDQKVVPLELNKAQRLLLDAVNAQLARRGFILKGRQMVSSTFVEAFLYWWVGQGCAQPCSVEGLNFRACKSSPQEIRGPPPRGSVPSSVPYQRFLRKPVKVARKK
jgi:hypothetical protein